MDNRLFAASHPNKEKRIENFLDAGPAILLGTECNINGMLFMEVKIPKAFCRKSESILSKWHNTTVTNYSNSWGHDIDWKDHNIVSSSGTFKLSLWYKEKECRAQIELFQDFFNANGFKTELNINDTQTAHLTFSAMNKDIALFINKYPHNCGGTLQAVKFDDMQALFNEPGNAETATENLKSIKSPSL